MAESMTVVPGREAIRSTSPPSFDEANIAINLRRTQLVGSVAFLDMLIQAALGLVRDNGPLTMLACSGAAIMLAFVVAATLVRSLSVPACTRKAITFGLIVALLLLAQGLAAAGSPVDKQVNGYLIVLIGVSALFKITLRAFITIALSTFVVMLGWNFSMDLPAGLIWQNAGTSFFVLSAAIMIRGILYQARLRDHELRTIGAQQNIALNKANQQLALRNYEMRETMAIAAHDLRSPMSGLHSLLQFAAERPGMAPETLRGLLTEASRSVAAMLDLVGRLLQAYEAEHGGAVSLLPHDLHRLASSAVDRIRLTAAATNVHVELIESDTPIEVRTNDEAVAQILDNLLSNAVRYTPRGGMVYVTCRRTASSGTIEVIDEGVGVPDNEQSQIFDKFHRGSRPPLAGNMGAGLGLYIAQGAAANISARLDYRPRTNGGSIFRLAIPLEEQA